MARQTKANRRTSRLKRVAFVAAVVVAIAGVVLIALELKGVTDFIGKTKKYPIRTASGYTKGEPLPEDNSAQNPESSGGQDDTKTTDSGPTADPNAKLLQPTGSFVSFHRPNLSGSPNPNTLNSSCETTPYATCQITFTKEGVTKGLETKKTDSGGGAYWTWKLQDIGLTEGSWLVQAKATLGTQILTADDSIMLEVAP